MRGAPITIRCDCGHVQYVAYGDRWECPTCGKRWNTAQIPSEEYWSIMRDMRRYRLQIIATTLALGGVLALLGVLVGNRFFLLTPMVLGGWFLLYMPRWRQKVRRRARSLPTWRLRPE